MRYKADQKQKTLRKMLEAAGRGFRSHGFWGIGVDGLAKAAGVTSGAFYSHFGSKKAAFDAALDAGLQEVIDSVGALQREHGAGWVQEFAEYYLGAPHRADLACGCAMTTLTPEVVRSGDSVHEAFEEKMTQVVDVIADGLVGASESSRRGRAWSMVSILVGGLTMARAMQTTTAADEIADATIAAAVKAAGRARSARS